MPLDPEALVARLDALEIRVAYQDQTIEDLNAAISGQWQEIERLRREMTRLEAEMRQAVEAASEGALPEPPPPHY